MVVLAAGAWSAGVHPVKGQMLAIEAIPPAQVVFGGGGYVVPRGNLTLVGATAEDVGFELAPTETGRAHLIGVARKHGYEDPKILDHWAGFRPATKDGLPLIGRASERKIFATGHYRNGVLLAPITGKIVAALLLGEKPPLDLAPFDPKRYGA
jgi:glycine oxidase